MAVDPVAAYRKQQGLGPITQSYDPKLVNMITRASEATGADSVALLATALQESGGQLHGKPGDHGTSFGPFQFHIGGALGSHSPAWASTYAAVLNRAHEFARLKVHGGVGAAAIQRPADQALYAKGVGSYLEQARAILNRSAPLTATTTVQADQPTPGLSSSSLDPSSLIAAINSDASTSDLLSLMQQAQGPGALSSAAKAVSSPKKGTPNSQEPGAFHGRVVALQSPKIIGTPHSGTHTLGNWESDNAVDIAMPVGTPIYAVADGVIGDQIGSLGANNPRFAGLRVHLKTKGDELYYAHLSKLAVRAGQRVKAGQLLGYSGSANGVAHLHLGSRAGHPGEYA